MYDFYGANYFIWLISKHNFENYTIPIKIFLIKIVPDIDMAAPVTKNHIFEANLNLPRYLISGTNL